MRWIKPPFTAGAGRRCAVLIAVIASGAWAASPAMAAPTEPPAASTCGGAIAGPARLEAEAAGVRVAFAPRDPPIRVGRHFALDLAVCGAAAADAPTLLRVDAEMPAHRHGMNYRPQVQALGDGRYRVEGLMFHMPGRWRLIFELGPPTHRVTRDVEVP